MIKGSKMSEESRKRCSDSRKGHVVSQSTKDKISAAHIGLGHTEETKDKLRKSSIRQHNLRPYESAYNTLKLNAKRRDLEATITYEEYLKIINVGECFYCGAILHWPDYNVRKSQASNLDRKDSSKGYITGNVVACCWPCNNIKNDHFTFLQFCEIGQLLRSWNFPNSRKGNPSYLNCVFCPSQAFPCVTQTRPGLLRYQCISKHIFFIIEETHKEEELESEIPRNVSVR